MNTIDLNKKESYGKTSKQPQQPSSFIQNLFEQYFGDFGGFRSNLADY